MTMQMTDNNPGLPQRPPNLLPAPPVYSSRELGWGGLLVERYQYPGGEYRVAPLPVHSLVLHLGRPLRMGQRRDGKTHTSLFLTNHFVVVPAGLPNTCWHKDGADELFINVDPQFVIHTAETVGVDPGRVEVANNFGARDPQLHYIALSLLQELRSPGLGGRLYVESLTNQLAVHLLRYYSTAAHLLPGIAEAMGLSPVALQRALAFVHDQLAQELSLADIAASVHLSPYHFARLFKQSVGMSPHQYVIAQRVEAAKRLLASGVATAQVAAEVGFADYSHLARHFKRLVGVPPAEFQRRKNLHP